MKLSYQDLEPHLSKTLSPMYLIHSDEILLADESAAAIRKAAHAAGYTERVSLDLENADWGKRLFEEVHSRSLFSSKRIVDLQLAAAKPNAAAAKILLEVVDNCTPDTLLIIRAHKLNATTEKIRLGKSTRKKRHKPRHLAG